MKTHSHGEGGFTIVELAIGMTVFSVVALSFLGLFTALVGSSVVAKQKAVAVTLATNQMEYLKSLPYDSLAVSGGAIVASSPLPSTVTKKSDGVSYTVKTSINYIDDAYDGCGSYANATIKAQLCRNQPAPAAAPATDLNPADYKIIHVRVNNRSGGRLAEVDSQIAARVAETASTTGALFVKVVDTAGNPVSGATIQVVNTTTTPNVNVSDSSDGNGVAVFYSLPPDASYDYKITASLAGYSTLVTIPPSGSLQPTYSSQKVVTQQSSFVTLTVKPQGTNSLVVETTNTTGAALGNVKVYVKGGYKKYTATTDTSYYFDNMNASPAPADVRPTTDGTTGLAALNNLVPGSYLFCGDKGDTGCVIGGTTYYLVAAVPYSGSDPFSPIIVPNSDPASPPATTFSYNGNSYLQKVRLMLTTSSSHLRIISVVPGHIDISSDPLSNFAFTVTGVNLPCSSTAASCGTTVKILQGSNTYTASCTGSTAATQIATLSCRANLSGISVGGTTMQFIAGGNTLNLPGAPLIGGFVVSP